jgi:6-phosphogluconolactonase (cycloisomerase 2 family)
MGYSSLASAGMGTSLLAEAESGSKARFAYVAAKDGGDEGIHAYSVGAQGWRKIQTMKSARPISLALSGDRKTLYAVNEIDSHKGLPVGTVEAFAIEANGQLRLLNRRKLALSAIHPRHAAVTPDGRSLVVAVSGGGAYNVLPIAEDGSLGSVSAILKEVGAERGGQGRKAEPQMVAFDKAGRVVSVDSGADRLSVFSLSNEGMAAQERVELEAGCRPTQVIMHPAGEIAYVMHGEAICCHGYDAETGSFSGEVHRLASTGVEGPATLALHPSGRFLYASVRGGGINAWNLSGGGDRLRRSLGVQAEEMGELNALDLAPDGRSMVGMSRSKGTVQRAEIDAATGRLSAGMVMTRVDSPSSLVVLYS